MNGQTIVSETGWVLALRAATRRCGFQEKTKRIYREWVQRFVQFIAPRAVDSVNASDVGGFLTALAVEHRSSRNAQKMAHHALTFFLREALQRPIDEVAFQRAQASRPAPTPLLRAEFERLRRQLDSATALIAELGSMADLRLEEVLRLRVGDIDLTRNEVRVRGNTGRVERTLPLRYRLEAAFERHQERLEKLHRLDRAAGLAGVSVPEGVSRTEPAAGLTFDWQWLFPARELGLERTTGLRRRHHVTVFAYERALRHAAIRARIVKKVTPPLLRHSFVAYVAINRATETDCAPMESGFSASRLTCAGRE